MLYRNYHNSYFTDYYDKERWYKMFGSKEDRLRKLIRKNRWGKISKILETADSQTKILFASECGSTKNEKSLNYLIALLRDDDEKVQLEAVKALGLLGKDSAKTHLLDILNNLPKEKTELYNAIRESISKINEAIAETSKAM